MSPKVCRLVLSSPLLDLLLELVDHALYAGPLGGATPQRDRGNSVRRARLMGLRTSLRAARGGFKLTPPEDVTDDANPL